MSITLTTPVAGELPLVLDAIRSWQHDGVALQLHPGDLGWAWQMGAPSLAAGLRTWAIDGRILSVGLLDGPTLLRMAIAPQAEHNQELAARMLTDITDPLRGVLPRGAAAIEARYGAAFRSRLQDQGWSADELWTPLGRDLTTPVQDCGMRIEIVGPRLARARADAQNASFDNSRFTEERWHTMAAGLPYTEGRCLIAYDDEGRAVATATVWSAGAGRPGLLEPMGVHRDHRRHGYGKAITMAAASALREMGSSSAIVCAESANTGAVATYVSAGFQSFPEVPDFRRDG